MGYFQALHLITQKTTIRLHPLCFKPSHAHDHSCPHSIHKVGARLKPGMRPLYSQPGPSALEAILPHTHTRLFLNKTHITESESKLCPIIGIEGF